ncbi:MAG: sigma-70 family RNA polymerase sigma factor [Vicinamibacteria bacterium]
MAFYQFDDRYLQRLQRRDPETEEHFAAYFERLIRIKVSRRVRSRQQVEDIRQETFARVFAILRSEQGLRQAGSLGALVNSVCNHVLAETQRRGRRDPPSSVECDLPDGSDSVLEGLITEEEARIVRAVIDELPERDRQVLVGVFLEEWSRVKLCADLQVTREYLRVLLHRALESFRARLSSHRAASPGLGRAEGSH